jgi:hypothetical protein
MVSFCILIPLDDHHSAMVDLDDYSTVSSSSWKFLNGMPVRSDGRTMVSILYDPDGRVRDGSLNVHYRDGNKLNLTRKNVALRLSTAGDIKKYKRLETPGVYWNTFQNCFTAYYRRNGHIIYLGNYIEEAEAARIAAAYRRR